MKLFLALNVAWCLMHVALTATIPLHKKSLDPNHVPSSVCESMVPHHNDSQPSAELPPYAIYVSTIKASPGDVIEVLAEGLGGAKFLGLYLQARDLNGGVNAVGKFVPENLQVNSAIRISNCPPGNENAISYISREPVDGLKLKWEVPENFSGKVYFRGTFVQSFAIFWVNVDSVAVEVTGQTVAHIPAA